VPPEADSLQRDDSYADMKYVPSRKSQELEEQSEEDEEIEVTKTETVHLPIATQQRPGFVLSVDQEPDISRDEEEILITTTHQQMLQRNEEEEDEEGVEVVFDHRAQDSDRKKVENDLYDEEIEVEYFNRPAEAGEEEQEEEEEEEEETVTAQKRVIRFGKEESDEERYAEEEQQDQEGDEEEREPELEN
jgi:hypothetical protein